MSRAIISLLWPKNIQVLDRYLSENKGVDVYTVNPFRCADLDTVVAKHGCKLFLLEHVIEEDSDAAGKKYLSEMLGKLKTYFVSGEWRDKCRGYDLDSTRLSNILSSRFEYCASAVVHYLACCEEVLKRGGIGLVVVNEDVMVLSRTVVSWAKRHGIPTIQLEHASMVLNNYGLHGRLLTDHLLLAGDRAKQHWLSLGIASERLTVTGLPYVDSLVELKEKKQEARRYLIDHYFGGMDRPVVVLGTTWATKQTALCEPDISEKVLASMFAAVKVLRAAGHDWNFLLKGRRNNAGGVEGEQPEIIFARHGIDRIAYTFDDALPILAGADVVVSYFSGLSLEAMQLETPAINLMGLHGLRLGPAFSAEDGVVEVDEAGLPDAILHLVQDGAFRSKQQSQLRLAAAFHNANLGPASRNVAAVFQEKALLSPVSKQFVWQRCLNVSEVDASGYHGGVRSDLVDFFTNDPKLVLDIGCAAGGTGGHLKKKYPQAKVWGIELSQSAATLAKEKLDRVLVGKFEDFDLRTEGIAPGTLDAVIVADVLEHMYNPWQVMTSLKPLLSKKAQVVASIPNIRNLDSMTKLANGTWTYEDMGILDVTHIRFFTYQEVLRFAAETGYRIVKTTYGLFPNLVEFYQKNKDRCPIDIDMGAMTLKQQTHDQLMELCSVQFFLLLEPCDTTEVPVSAGGSQATVVANPEEDYYQFLIDHQLRPSEAMLFEQRIQQWGRQPVVHFAVITTEETLPQLVATISSLTRQYYPAIHITVLAPSAAPDGFADSDRMRWVSYQGDAYLALSKTLLAVPADWVGVLQSGDQLVPQALLHLLEMAHAQPQSALLYSDEDMLGEDGKPTNPYFKPDYSPDYLLAFPYIGDFALYRADLFGAAGGFDPAKGGAAAYDLQLRLIDMAGDGVVSHVPDVLFHRHGKRSLDLQPTAEIVAACSAAVIDHLARHKVKADVAPGPLPGSNRIRYQCAQTPLVSIIIPTRENGALLQRCIESLFADPGYPHFEILIVDGGSQLPDTVKYLAALSDLGSDTIKVFVLAGETNISRIRNLAANEAAGEILLFLDDDTAVVNKDWLVKLVSQILRPEIGIVGARLLDASGTVNDAGRLLPLVGAADTPFRGLKVDQSGYFGRLQTEQNYSAISASCMMLRAADFRQLGGFDEAFPLFHADTDLCMRSRQLGRRILWTPDVNLLHTGGASVNNASVLDGEKRHELMEAALSLVYERWLPQLAEDPAYNRNQSQFAPFHVAEKSESTRLFPTWKPLPRLVAYPGDAFGCGNYRIIQPFEQARRALLADGHCGFNHHNLIELAKMQPDTLILQRQIADEQIDTIRKYKRFYPAKLVFEIDDLLTNLPVKSLHRAAIAKDMAKRLRVSIGLCDRLIVSTESLAEAYRDFHSDIKVVKNSIDGTIWGGLTSLRKQGCKPRVGWAGGISHTGDLELVRDVVKELAGEVEWVFFGMCPDSLRPFIHEFHAGVEIAQYPAKLASLNLDLAIAPLEHNPFNEGKSNLRLLEYGILGLPVIATDFVPYQGDFPVTLVKNRQRDWVKAIRDHIHDLDESARRGDALRAYVNQNWMLEQHVHHWMKAWFEF